MYRFKRRRNQKVQNRGEEEEGKQGERDVNACTGIPAGGQPLFRSLS
jgi:hypothetical protein